MSFKGGQSLEDKLYAFRYIISGHGISYIVLKATTSEMVGSKKKHLDYLISMTNETNVSVPNLTKSLMRRAKHPNWCVSFKALITIHHLMSYGNERFIQNLASSTVNNRSFDILASYMDESSISAIQMSTFVRRYSLYLKARIQIYRSLGQDFCQLIAPKLAKMSHEQIMKTLPILQEQFDSLLAFDASLSDLNNAIISQAFAALYADFAKLYIAYQMGILHLLELFFDVTQSKRAQELYEVYWKFLVLMDKVSDYVRVLESVGIDKNNLPDFNKPKPMFQTMFHKLERHMKQLEPSKTNTSKRKPSAADAVKWQLIKLGPPNLRATGTGRRRSSLWMSHQGVPSSSLSAATTEAAEVPRLKSPGEVRKRWQRIATLATTEMKEGSFVTDEQSNANGKTNCDQKRIIKGTGLEATVPGADPPDIQQQQQMATTRFDDRDLLLDTCSEQPDLILINEDCSPGLVVGVQQQPSDWVKV